MTSSVNIHASCVVLARAGEAFGAPPDAGILLLGESGSGKSDLALRLIARGAMLVADDRCDLFLQDGVLRARAPAVLAGLIEIRAVGIIALPFAADARVTLAVRLVAPQGPARLPEPAVYEPPAALRVPRHRWPSLVELAPFEASAPAKIAAAARGKFINT
ncbi:MAG TPA: hypothetical protein VGI20_13330 [Rhizomicrobium sp.]|jgi:serine kinase of HPr protein (carbohydrate metabolism regulator)